MDEPQATVEPVSTEEPEQPKPATDSQEELRKLQSAKDREIAELRNTMAADNRRLADELEGLRRQTEEAQIRAIEDPEERASAIVKARERQLNDRERAIYAEGEARARPIVMAMLAHEHGVPVEVLAPARTGLEMENLALKWKLEHAGQELEKVQKEATKPAPPAAASQKFAQGSGAAPSSYDPSKFRGTGDLAGSLRAKREAGL